MLRIIIRRLFQAVFVVIGVVTLVFFFLRLAPGDPVTLLAPQASDEIKAQIRDQIGLDDPVIIQYFNFLEDVLLHADFGDSFFSPGVSVISIIIERIGLTLLLTGIAIGIAITCAFPLGVLAATKKNSLWDRSSLIITMFFQSAPSFWVGMILLLFFSVKLHLMPSVGYRNPTYAILPGIALSLSLIAVLTRVIRNSLTDVLENEHIRAAIARGIPNRLVIWRHGLKSIAVPVVTVIGAQMAYLLGGAVIVEFIFNYPGLGLLTLNAALRRDYPLIQAIVGVMAIIFVLMNLLVDIIYGFIDPRARESV